MKYLVSVSGGLGSAEALRCAIEQYGRENVIAVFADVKGRGDLETFGMPTVQGLLHERYGGESRDTYRFIWQLSHLLDINIHRIEDGRTIWQVFYERKALSPPGKGFGYCPASEELKSQVIADWIKKNLEPRTFTMLLGMSADEQHRIKKAKENWKARLGYNVEVTSPLLDRLLVDNAAIIRWLQKNDIQPPSAYGYGYSHNNCNRVCVLAGQTSYALLYKEDKDAYMHAAWREATWQRATGSKATILVDRRKHKKVNGKGVPMSLYEFAERIERGDIQSSMDVGVCQCFVQPSIFSSD